MNLNLNKNTTVEKKSNIKKYILNTIIILFMLGSGGLLGESFSDGVTQSDYDKAKIENETYLNNLKNKQSELNTIDSNITEKTSNIDILNSQLEAEKSKQ